jgi:hypothetical protein
VTGRNHTEKSEWPEKHGGHARDWIFIMHMFPANQLLPDRNNAHVSHHDTKWWVKAHRQNIQERTNIAM